MQQPPNYPGDWQQPPQSNTQYPPPQWQGMPAQPNTQYPQQWQPQQYTAPPNTYYPPQQAPWNEKPWQPAQPPMMSPQPPLPPRKKRSSWLIIGIILGAIVLCSGVAGATGALNQQSSATQTVPTDTSASATDTPVPTATDTPSPTPTPTVDPAQVEKLYKALTKNTTVDNLDKDGNVDKGKDVHLTCKILDFVKDDSGNTAGANCDNPNSYSASVIQIGFPSSTDITKLNEGDIMEVWGIDQGVFSGKNAFGGDVQEVGVAALYMTDTTTGYQTS